MKKENGTVAVRETKSPFDLACEKISSTSDLDGVGFVEAFDEQVSGEDASGREHTVAAWGYLYGEVGADGRGNYLVGWLFWTDGVEDAVGVIWTPYPNATEDEVRQVARAAIEGMLANGLDFAWEDCDD